MQNATTTCRGYLSEVNNQLDQFIFDGNVCFEV